MSDDAPKVDIMPLVAENARLRAELVLARRLLEEQAVQIDAMMDNKPAFQPVEFRISQASLLVHDSERNGVVKEMYGGFVRRLLSESARFISRAVMFDTGDVSFKFWVART